MPNTKIVATLGPACDSPAMLRSLLCAGADVIRLNASHGSQEKHAERISVTRQVAAEIDRHIGILLDLQGPKIRLGTFEGGSCRLEKGAHFTITVEPILGNSERAYTGYTNFAMDVKAGDRVLLADGVVELRALKSDGTCVRFEVINGGVIGDNKGINLPGVRVSTSSLTEKDLSDLRFGVEQKIDMVALSFVRSSEDIRRLRRELPEGSKEIPVIAKIEKPEAWNNIDEILEEADGVMVARGDLGVEMAVERVPVIQKAIIQGARRRGKFVITATQMLESMVNSPMPTRAEVSDVANAIFDGTDAVMLSAETSVGHYPLEAVRCMARVADEAERSLNSQGARDPVRFPNPTFAEIIAKSVYYAASDASVLATVVFTTSGSSARLISRLHPHDPIYAITTNAEAARRLACHYGVRAILTEPCDNTDEMLELADRLLVERCHLKPGDSVVFVAGQPVGHRGSTNMMKLHRIGENR